LTTFYTSDYGPNLNYNKPKQQSSKFLPHITDRRYSIRNTIETMSFGKTYSGEETGTNLNL